MALRSDIIRIASELPQGDATRRDLLATLKRGMGFKDGDDALKALQGVRSYKDLNRWAEALQDSGLLDESEQVWTRKGPIGPWQTPPRAKILMDTGEDILIQLPSGEITGWINWDRAWTADPQDESVFDSYFED